MLVVTSHNGKEEPRTQTNTKSIQKPKLHWIPNRKLGSNELFLCESKIACVLLIHFLELPSSSAFKLIRSKIKHCPWIFLHLLQTKSILWMCLSSGIYDFCYSEVMSSWDVDLDQGRQLGIKLHTVMSITCKTWQKIDVVIGHFPFTLKRYYQM